MSTTDPVPHSADAVRVLAEILSRYSSLDAFCVRLRRELDEPTIVLAPVTLSADEAPGRHSLRVH